MSVARYSAAAKQDAGAFQRYPRDCWYVAAGGSEVTRTPMARKLVDESVMLFRKENGDAVAMSNYCPHRGFPLSESRVIGDTVECGYHGMLFNTEGKCLRMAGPGGIPNVMRVRTFPVVEKRHYIWIWVGDPAKADPSLIPSAPYEDDDSFDHQYYYPLPFNGNFQLARDNLLDATHVSFLHPNMFDNEDNKEFINTKRDSTIEPNRITEVTVMENFLPNASVQEIWHVPADRPLTRKITVVNSIPCYVTIQNQFFDQATGAVVSERCTNIGLVPADMSHGYHFTAVSSSFKQTERDKEAQLFVLKQDIFALEQIQAYFEQNPNARETNVPSDKNSILSRRMLTAMVEAEERDASELANVQVAAE
jgi:phenylpropionate dioxygenase-like ring-hydroxylating dioxygenase large terminal subunit